MKLFFQPKLVPALIIGCVLVQTSQLQAATVAPATNATTSLVSAPLADAPQDKLTLWYRQPAAVWTEALAIGNGRLGAMVFGGVARERLQLNEDTLWAGGPYDQCNTNALAALPEVRQLIFDGKYDEADALTSHKIMSRPLGQMQYQTMGDLWLDFPISGSVQEYRRDLSLSTAVARVSFCSDGVTFTREVFSSPVDQVMVMRLTADKPGRISFVARMKTPQKASLATESGNTLVMTGVNGDAQGVKGALRFQARVCVMPHGGRLEAGANSLTLSNADSALVIIAAATSYKNYHDLTGDPQFLTQKQIASAAKQSFKDLLKAHVREHQRLFGRVALNLGESAAMQMPTDERIKHFAEGSDPQLAALYFQFGRYLLISCSRPGCQPATLQGLWNESMNPPWGSKYTININTEMNYWPADSANLGECVEPLTAMVLDLAESGRHTAQVLYNAHGWVAHHNTDLWRATGPIDGPGSGMWPSGGAWLCQSLWDHYLFNGDQDYLKRIYPALKGAAEFFLDTLVEEPTHKWLVTCPSLSPENGHPEGHSSLCAGPTMDLELLRDLFNNCIRASQTLGIDPEFRQRLIATRDRLAPLQIGAQGQLQEWLKDWDAKPGTDPHHRHISHLYGLFPSGQIDLRQTPELAAAAAASLNTRGDISTGWAIAWRINCWARLHDGDRTYNIVKALLEPSRTYPNFFDAHPPFQIDGNFGGTSGIAEMLLQSQNGEIELLPALPKTWPTGSIKGLVARGGFEVDMQWQGGKLQRAQLKSLTGAPCHLRYGDKTAAITLKRGKSLKLNADLAQCR